VVWVARELAISPSPEPAGDADIRFKSTSLELKLPAFVPSTFLLKNFDAKEWITITGRDRKKKFLEKLRWPLARIWREKVLVSAKLLFM
jgi:hypothetical protein